MKNLLKHLKGFTTEEAQEFIDKEFFLFDNICSQEFYKTKKGYITQEEVDNEIYPLKKRIELLHFIEKKSNGSIYIVALFGGKKLKYFYYLSEQKAYEKWCSFVDKFKSRFAEIVWDDSEIDFINSDEFEKNLKDSLEELEKIKKEHMSRKKYWWLPLDNYNQPSGSILELELNDDELKVMKNKGEYIFDSYYQAMLSAYN